MYFNQPSIHHVMDCDHCEVDLHKILVQKETCNQEGIVPDIYDIDVSIINQSVYANRCKNRFKKI